MKRLLVVLALSGCTWDEHLIRPAEIGTRPDPAAAVMIQCDKLMVSRYSDAHRLCVMRGVDKLAVVPGPGYAPITILPHAYPPLVPQGTITVVPMR